MAEFTLKKGMTKIAEKVVEIELEHFNYIEKTKKFEYDILSGNEKIISFEGVQLYFGELETKGLISFDILFDQPSLILTFEIEGGYIFKDKLSPSDEVIFQVETNEYNCAYFPKISGVMQYACENRKYFTVLVSKSYILKLFRIFFPKISDRYCNLMLENKQFTLFENSKAIPLSIYNVINEVITCYFVEEIKETYIKSKVIDLFVHIFSSLTSIDMKIKKEDRVLAQNIYSYVTENYKNNMSLESISIELGTNKTKLKKVFKEVYNETIFEFRFSYKMQKAKEMLVENTVTEVAEMVGYKNPQHFTTAFKKKFGYLPSYFKNSI